MDYENLLDMQAEYPLDRFANEILIEEKYELGEIFEKEIAVALSCKISNKTREDTLVRVQSNKSLHNLLKELRVQLAKREELPLHCIFTNKALEQICAELPKNFDELKHIQGFGEKRTQKY